MRSDYVSYAIAAIFFILAVIVFAAFQPPILEPIIWTALVVILAILGLIFVGVGYSQKTKSSDAMLPEKPETLREESKPETKAVGKRRKKGKSNKE